MKFVKHEFNNLRRVIPQPRASLVKARFGLEKEKFKALIENLENLTVYPDEFTRAHYSPGIIETSEVVSFAVPGNSFDVRYCLAIYSGNKGYLAVSESLFHPKKNKNVNNIFYAPTFEGALEFLECIKENPLNLSFRDLKLCFFFSKPEDY